MQSFCSSAACGCAQASHSSSVSMTVSITLADPASAEMVLSLLHRRTTPPFKKWSRKMNWQGGKLPPQFSKKAQATWQSLAPLFFFDCSRQYSLLYFREYCRKQSNIFGYICKNIRILPNSRFLSLNLSKKTVVKQRLCQWQPYIAQYP